MGLVICESGTSEKGSPTGLDTLATKGTSLYPIAAACLWRVRRASLTVSETRLSCKSLARVSTSLSAQAHRQVSTSTTVAGFWFSNC